MKKYLLIICLALPFSVGNVSAETESKFEALKAVNDPMLLFEYYHLVLLEELLEVEGNQCLFNDTIDSACQIPAWAVEGTILAISALGVVYNARGILAPQPAKNIFANYLSKDRVTMRTLKSYDGNPWHLKTNIKALNEDLQEVSSKLDEKKPKAIKKSSFPFEPIRKVFAGIKKLAIRTGGASLSAGVAYYAYNRLEARFIIEVDELQEELAAIKLRIEEIEEQVGSMDAIKLRIGGY